MEDFPEDVQRAFYAQTGFSIWSVLDGTTPVSRLADAQIQKAAPAREPPTMVGAIPARGAVEDAADEALVLCAARVEVSVPRKKSCAPGRTRARGNAKAAPQTPAAPAELAPAIEWTDLAADVEAIDGGSFPAHASKFASAQFDSSIGIRDYQRASALMKASRLTRKPALRRRYVAAAAKLVEPPRAAPDEADAPEEDEEDSDDALVRKPQPCPLERETRPFRDWLERATAMKQVLVDMPLERMQSMNYYNSCRSYFPWPSIDSLVDHTWVPSPVVVPQTVATVPSFPEGLEASEGYVVQGIGNKRIADFQIKAERDLRLAKRRAIRTGAFIFGDGSFDPFGPHELGGMPKPKPPPTLEMADMLKERKRDVATFRHITALGPASGIHLFVYDELVPPLRAVPGMLTTTALFYQRKTRTRAFDRFPWTERLEYAGPHDKGPLFAPIDKTPQAIMDNDHMRAYIAPVQADETTDFVVRMKNGRVVEIVPVHSRVAVGQVFPKHRKKSVKKELENMFYNRLLPEFFPASQGGMGRPRNSDRLLRLRPKLMDKPSAEKALKSFTSVVGPKLVSYNYALGLPEVRQECTYAVALESSMAQYVRVSAVSSPERRAIDPTKTVGVLERYLDGKGLLIRGGWGAPDPGAVNLSGLQTLKSGATQAKEDLEIFPEIVGGMYPLPREKDAVTGKAKKRREGSSSDTRKMTRAQYRAKLASLRETIRRDTADAEFLDAKLALLRANKDTTSDRWEIIRFLNAHDTADPTLQMNQNTLRRFSMNQVCSESCRQTIHAFAELVRTGEATLDNLPPRQKYAHELRTRELQHPPFLERFTIHVMYRGGRDEIFSEGNNSKEAWALKTFYTARKLAFYHKLEREFSTKLFHGTHDDDGLKAEIAEIQDLKGALENDLLAGMPITDAYAQKLVRRAKNGTL